jgi:hypothetical protein
MKYRDILTVFLGIAFFLSLGYAVGVSQNIWFWIVPFLLLLSLLLMYVYVWKK